MNGIRNEWNLERMELERMELEMNGIRNEWVRN
jgi:hypothetical protein